MADYRGGGGGGGGTSVVPVNFVVGSTRADYPLTEAGLLAAIAALPAEGGTIYIGSGDLTITAAIALPNKVVTFLGAGSGPSDGATKIVFTGPAALFTVSGAASYFYFRDIYVEGDSSAGQILFNATGNGLGIQTDHFTCTGIEVGLHVATGVFCFWYAIDTTVQVPAQAASFHANTVDSGGAYIQAIASYFTVAGNAQFGGMNGNVGIEAVDTIFYGATAFEIGAVYFSECSFYYTAIDVNIYPFPHFENCSFITKKTGQDYWINISSVTSLGAIISGCTFQGTLDTADILIDDATGCVVSGNTKITGAGASAFPIVNETGTANNNKFDAIDSTSSIIGALSVVRDAQNEEVEVSVSNVTSSTYSTSGVRYIPLAKVANPNEEYVQAQFQARRSGRVRLYIDYAMSVNNGGDLQIDYSGAAIQDGDDPDAALGALLSETFTPGAGTTRKTRVVDTTLDVAPGDDVILKILRDDAAGDTHTGSWNILTLKAVVW